MAGFYMDERFGAWQVGNDPNQGAVQFKLFFPDRAKSPSLTSPVPVSPIMQIRKSPAFVWSATLCPPWGCKAGIGSMAPP
jgi:hypothetical protein